MSVISELLPLPETPVMTVNVPKGTGQRHVVQVVLACAGKLEAAALGLATLLRHGDHATTGKVISRKRTFRGRHLLRRSGSYHHAAALARARTHVHHIISSADGILVVLDDDNGVAEIAQDARACR